MSALSTPSWRGFLHAGCALYLDTLVSAGPHFQTEQIASLPLKNPFERCQHLIANFSEAEFQTLVTLNDGNREAKTGGMTQPVQAVIVPRVGEVYQLHF